MTGRALAGRTILVTRPAGQAERLCRMIERAGGRALRFPLLEIAVVDGTAAEAAGALLDNYGNYDAMIFISRNAVIFAEKLRPALFARETLPAVYASGPGTRAELEARGIVAATGRNSEYGTEGLLRLQSLSSRSVAGKRLLIVRGEGGREKLKAGLEERGARVDYVEVYLRRIPEMEADTMQKLWQDQRPGVIVVTSVQSLENLLALGGPECRRSLLETPLAVMSPRIARRAGELGFMRPPCVAGGTGDRALTAAVIEAAAQIG